MVVQIKKTKKKFLLMLGTFVSLSISFFLIRLQEKAIGNKLLYISPGIVHADATPEVGSGDGGGSDGCDGCDGCCSDGSGGT